MKIINKTLFFLFLFVCFYLGIKESKISPKSYLPPTKIPLIGAISPNELLQNVEILAKGKLDGPEAISFDTQGNFYTGTKNGKIYKLDKTGKEEIYFENLKRPLGLKMDKDNSLYIADAYLGLLKLDKDKKLEVLVPYSEEFKLIDDLVLVDSKIYFSNASSKFVVDEYLYDLLEGIPHGGVYEYDKNTKQIKKIISDMSFANGIALSEKKDFLVINETYRYRIRKYYLSGEKKGKEENFMETTPGFPDNITSNGKGEFCLAIYTVRNSLLDLIHPFELVTKQYSKLPKFLWPKPKPYGFIVILNEQGEILRSYQDTTGKIAKGITSCIEQDDFYYIGFLHEDKILKVKKNFEK